MELCLCRARRSGLRLAKRPSSSSRDSTVGWLGGERDRERDRLVDIVETESDPEDDAECERLRESSGSSKGLFRLESLLVASICLLLGVKPSSSSERVTSYLLRPFSFWCCFRDLRCKLRVQQLLRSRWSRDIWPVLLCSSTLIAVVTCCDSVLVLVADSMSDRTFL